MTLSWSKWTPDDARDNYLCIKRNDYIFGPIRPFLADPHSPITMFSELRFADKNAKAFKKVLVEFIGAKLACYKDAKAEKSIGQWNIEDITWFLGAEKKRNAPTQWCFTFIERDLHLRRTKDSPFFGRTISCNTEEEFFRWMAAMLSAEFPSGVLPVKPKVDLMS